ncbi:hypothetical protein [Arthrobacter globiformis]|uniref:hypothetical protein n=1 Tax=Arthrobacter globiformis TaxID=1665 RepID=UPI0027826079|nr:hypothetical protein [Arthrobacter globiformis]MDQ0865560.1 hypothetical protein [Arthrobacter globiformis]
MTFQQNSPTEEIQPADAQQPANLGLEAQHISVSGGTVTVTATDDGVNASGGAPTATQSGGGMGGGPGGGESVGGYSVDISGGSLTINSEGDGLDSNGNASISGGTWWSTGPKATATAHWTSTANWQSAPHL